MGLRDMPFSSSLAVKKIYLHCCGDAVAHAVLFFISQLASYTCETVQGFRIFVVFFLVGTADVIA